MNIKWNTENYTADFGFVHKYGEDLLGLITVPKGGFVVDVGCGSGALTEKLNSRGYNVLGIDDSEDMIKKARLSFPELRFMTANALDFSLDEKADAIFSNAVFHWIDADKQDILLENIARNLKQNGELVFEFGGKGCAECVHSALERAFSKHGLTYPRVFYFPTVGEYAPLLEKHGFRVEYALFFDRFTEQKGDIADWIEMFVQKPFEGMDKALKSEIVNEAVSDCPELYVNGKYYVDYVRIRMKAILKRNDLT